MKISKLGVVPITMIGISLIASAEATVIRQAPLHELADRAELVCVGTVVGSQVALSRDGSFPFTFVTLAIGEVLKGHTAPELTLRMHGGVTPAGGVVVHGMPALQTGGTYLLFVSGNGTDACPILGWGQGLLELSQDVSGRPIFLDERGAQVAGISPERWRIASSAAQIEAEEVGPVQGAAPAARFLESPDTLAAVESPDVPREAAHAGDVVAALRDLLASRASFPTFRPGRPVISADPGGVPFTVGGIAVAPRQ